MEFPKFTIIAAIDESDQARLVLERVVDEAVRHNAADLHILRVIDVKQKYADRIPVEDERDALLVQVNDVLASFDAVNLARHTQVHMRIGRPDEEIISLSHETRADVIVIGRHGESRRRGAGGRERRMFAGNTVERVLHTAPCMVLVIQDLLYDEEPANQCAGCVRVRRESGGETWFCEAHRDDDRPLHDISRFGGLSLHTVGFGSGGVF